MIIKKNRQKELNNDASIPELSNIFNIENDNFNGWCMDKQFYKYYIKKYYLAISSETPEDFFNLDYDFFEKYNEYKKAMEK